MAMRSTEISAPPKGEQELRVWLQQILQAHYEDIKTLYLGTTDYDRVEKLREDNARS